MTAPNAPDVGMLRELNDALGETFADDPANAVLAHAAVSPLMHRLEEQLAQARGGLADAYDAGFMASGEGWNGEHGGDTDSRHYLKRRAEYFAALATQTGATHES